MQIQPIVVASCFRVSLLVMAGILLSISLGCGDGRDARVPVSGVVTVDGKPLEHGSISFMPVGKIGTISRPGGASLENGRFAVSSFTPNDGLMKGNYEVMISGIEPINETAQRWHAPKKYANMKTSGLTLEVSTKLEEVKFELTWEGDKHSKPFVEKF